MAAPTTDGPIDAGADGGISFSGDQPPTADGVTNLFPADPAGMTSISDRFDITKVAPDKQGGNDIEDPYPGGDTPSLGLPLDG